MIPHKVMVEALQVLSDAGLPNAQREIRMLWEHADENENQFHSLIERRALREPMSHILGKRAFFESEFLVTADVLDPRPETETLVLAALEKDFHSILDLGTGSGCILLSLLKKRTHARGVGVDSSEGALKVAAQNAGSLNVIDRCELVCSDWFGDVTGQFDLIVSNPPYISLPEMSDLQPEVRLHEPRSALTDEADGLTAYRKITSQAFSYLAPEGWIMFEIGPTQAPDVSQMLVDAGADKISVLHDLDGRDRVIIGQKPSEVV